MRKTRLYLQIAFLALAVIIPMIIFFLTEKINAVTLSKLAAFYPFWYTLPYCYIWQAGPFILLAMLCRRKKQNATFRHNSCGLIGAAIGAVLASVVPYFLLSNAQETTADIGLGFLFICMPFYFVPLIFLGWLIPVITLKKN